MKIFNIYVACFCLTLAACGGGGDDLSSNQQAADGLWDGEVTASDGSKTLASGLILDDGRYFFITKDSDNNITYVSGNSSVSGSTISSNNLLEYYPSIQEFIPGSFTGTVSSNSTLSLTISESYKGKTESAIGKFAFNSQYNESSSINKIAGSYAGNGFTFLIESSGKFTVDITNENSCTISGEITLRNPNKNVYSVRMYPNNCYILASHPLSGAASLIKNISDGKYYLHLIGNGSSNGMYYFLYLPGMRTT
jgi:hypothetical protein